MTPGMRRLATIGWMVAIASPLASQQSTTSPAALIARADSLLGDDSKTSLELTRRAISSLAEAGNDSLRLRAYLIRCWAAPEAAPDSLAAFAKEGLAAAERAANPAAVAEFRVCRGFAYENAGDPVAAMDDYEAGVEAGRRLAHQELLAEALVHRGEIGYYRGDFNRAIQDLNESYQLFTTLGKPRRVEYALNAIANLYADSRMGQYDRALEYYRQLLESHVTAGRQGEIAVTYYNIASTLERMNRLDEALAEYRRGLAIDQQRNDANEVATDRRAIGVVLYKLGRPADALRELEAVLAHNLRSGDPDETARTRLSRGITLRMLARTSESIADLEAARTHFTATKNRRFLEKTQEELAIAYAAAGQWRAAYDARGEQLTLQKALETEAREEQSARLRTQFEADKRDQENRALARENSLRGDALVSATRIRRLQLAVIGLAAIVILVLGGFVTKQIAAARRLRVLAMVDELTQVPNRRAVLQLAEEQARIARSGGDGFAMLAVDVDFFKRINDTYGHEAGDTVLRRVASVCRLALRPGDHVGRTGGEEFAVVLPGADASAAADVAERLRRAVESTSFGEVAADLAVTISVGTAVWAAGDRTAADVQRRADDSLYEVKRTGRNRVGVAAAV